MPLLSTSSQGQRTPTSPSPFSNSSMTPDGGLGSASRAPTTPKSVTKKKVMPSRPGTRAFPPPSPHAFPLSPPPSSQYSRHVRFEDGSPLAQRTSSPKSPSPQQQQKQNGQTKTKKVTPSRPSTMSGSRPRGEPFAASNARPWQAPAPRPPLASLFSSLSVHDPPVTTTSAAAGAAAASTTGGELGRSMWARPSPSTTHGTTTPAPRSTSDDTGITGERKRKDDEIARLTRENVALRGEVDRLRMLLGWMPR